MIQSEQNRNLTTVGILGVMHDERTRNRYGLTLTLIGELIHEFAPDVICGEVLPSSWDLITRGLADEGYWRIAESEHLSYWAEPASEYWRLIFPLCREKDILFVPIDWLELDVWWDFDPFHGFTEPDRLLLEAERASWHEKQLETYRLGPIPFNSSAYDELARAKHKWLQQVNPDSYNFRWVIRHLIMIQRVKKAINQNPGKRILVVAGADHNYSFYDGLRTEPIELIYPLR